MAANTKRAKESAMRAGEAAAAARSNPYVKRLIEDEDLRESIKDAYESVRGAYARMSNGKGPAKAIQDKKTQRALRDAVENLRDVSEQIREKPKRKRRGRILVLVAVGAGLALVLSEGTRKAVLDRLFGSEEEFEYTSNTSPAAETANA